MHYVEAEGLVFRVRLAICFPVVILNCADFHTTSFLDILAPANRAALCPSVFSVPLAAVLSVGLKCADAGDCGCAVPCLAVK